MNKIKGLFVTAITTLGAVGASAQTDYSGFETTVTSEVGGLMPTLIAIAGVAFGISVAYLGVKKVKSFLHGGA